MPSEAFLRRMRERCQEHDMARPAVPQVTPGTPQAFQLDPEGVRGIEDGRLLCVREQWAAVRLHSKVLDQEVWLARDENEAGRLGAEFPGMPVFTIAEIPHLRNKRPELLKAIAETKATFPEARLRA